MDVRDLQCFVAVAEECSFTRAAERLLVAQPAVSQRIRAIERSLGRRLFERSSRHVALTGAGRRLLEIGRPLLDQFEAVDEQIRSAAPAITEDLRVAAVTTLPGVRLSTVVQTFLRHHPSVRFVLRELTTATMLDELAAGTIDLAIAQAPALRPRGLRVDELAHDDFVLVVPPRHRLARRDQVRMGELRTEPFITLDPGSGMHRTLRAAARRAGFEPVVTVEVLQVSTVRELVSAGLGIALIPRAGAGPSGPAVATVTIAPALARPIVIATPEDGGTPGAQAFRELVVDVFARVRAHGPVTHL